jgi:hypothetical protein
LTTACGMAPYAGRAVTLMDWRGAERNCARQDQSQEYGQARYGKLKEPKGIETVHEQVYRDCQNLELNPALAAAKSAHLGSDWRVSGLASQQVS